MLPPVVSRASFAIRKKALLVYTLDDYVAQGILSPSWADYLKTAVRNKKNILIVGGTDSGKTTFANAVLAEIARYNDTILIIEDTYELQCSGNDVVEFRASNNGSGDMRSLLKSALRFDPDRIIVGEVRGPEALTLLDSWNTGHPGGLSTIHADSAQKALRRLEQLILQGTRHVSRQMIADAVDVIVYIESDGIKRKIKDIVEVEGFKDDYIFKKI
jgi:type IV secretion system protein VirB11